MDTRPSLDSKCKINSSSILGGRLFNNQIHMVRGLRTRLVQLRNSRSADSQSMAADRDRSIREFEEQKTQMKLQHAAGWRSAVTEWDVLLDRRRSRRGYAPRASRARDGGGAYVSLGSRRGARGPPPGSPRRPVPHSAMRPYRSPGVPRGDTAASSSDRVRRRPSSTAPGQNPKRSARHRQEDARNPTAGRLRLPWAPRVQRSMRNVMFDLEAPNRWRSPIRTPDVTLGFLLHRSDR